jgi:hypothetical protein
VAAAAGLVAVVLMGLADDDSGPPAGVELDDLEPALLTGADLGDGFEEDDPTVPADPADAPVPDYDELDISDSCREFLESSQARRAEREVLLARFARRADAVNVTHELALVHPDEPSLAEVAASFRRCDRLVYGDADSPTEERYEAVDVGGLGDEAIGVTITVIGGEELSYQLYELIVMRQGVLSTIAVTGPVEQEYPETAQEDGPPRSRLERGPADRDLARDLAATADERIGRLLD